MFIVDCVDKFITYMFMCAYFSKKTVFLATPDAVYAT